MLALVAWAGIGLLFWLRGSDAEQPSDPASDWDATSADQDVPEDLTGAGDAATELPAVAPELESVQARMSAEQFLASLGNIHSDENKARIRAWLQKEPARVAEFIVAIRKLIAWGPRPRSENHLWQAWKRFFPDVFGPLRGLEAQLTAALIPLLGASEGAASVWISRPSLRVLQALAPVSTTSREALEAWVREHETSKWSSDLARLIVESATSGEEIEPFVNWLLRSKAHGVHIQSAVMPGIAKLGTAGRCLIPLLAEHVFEVRYMPSATVRALVAIGPDEPASQRALVAAWMAGGSSPRSANAAHEYFKQREDAQQILLAALKDDSSRVRHSAVMALLMKGWAEADVLISPLLRCLTDPDPVWRDKAMRSLPSLITKTEQVVPFLEAMFRSTVEQQWVTAAETLRLLAGWKGTTLDLSTAISEAMRHDNVRVRRVMVEGLRFYPPPMGVPLLASALEDDDTRVREMAADAHGNLAGQDAAARSALENAVNHRDPQVVAMAEAWLEELRDLSGDTSTSKDQR